MLWEIDIYPAPGQPDRLGLEVAANAAELGIASGLKASSATGYLIQGSLDLAQVERLANELFADAVIERPVIGRMGDAILTRPPSGEAMLVHVLPKPGVMDPVAQSVQSAIADFGFSVDAVRTLRKFWLSNLPAEKLPLLAIKVLANDAIEQVVVGPLKFNRLELGGIYEFQLVTVKLVEMDNAALMNLSRAGQLFLTLPEMQTIQNHFRQLGRNPTDAELETLAQTWSEHCSHKTLAGNAFASRDAPDGTSDISRTCSRRRFSPPRKKFAPSAGQTGRTIGASVYSRTTPAS